MEIYTQMPDTATRDALRKLSDFLCGPQDIDAEGRADPPKPDLARPSASLVRARAGRP